VAFVALASVVAPNQIVSAIGDTLNLAFAGQSDPTAYLLKYLRKRYMLLVLDSFEHLLEGADLAYDILQRAPHVSILVTSRERLNLQAEWLFDVEGLLPARRPARVGRSAKPGGYGELQCRAAIRATGDAGSAGVAPA